MMTRDPEEFYRNTGFPAAWATASHRLEEKVFEDIVTLLSEVERLGAARPEQMPSTRVTQQVNRLLEQVQLLQMASVSKRIHRLREPGKSSHQPLSASEEHVKWSSSPAFEEHVALRELLLVVRGNLQLLLDKLAEEGPKCGAADSDVVAEDLVDPWEGYEDIALEDLLEWFSHAISKTETSAGPSPNAARHAAERRPSLNASQQVEESQPVGTRQSSTRRLPLFSFDGSRSPSQLTARKTLPSSTGDTSVASTIGANLSSDLSQKTLACKSLPSFKPKFSKVETRNIVGTSSNVSNVSTSASLSSAANIRTLSESPDGMGNNETRRRRSSESTLQYLDKVRAVASMSAPLPNTEHPSWSTWLGFSQPHSNDVHKDAHRKARNEAHSIAALEASNHPDDHLLLTPPSNFETDGPLMDPWEADFMQRAETQ